MIKLARARSVSEGLRLQKLANSMFGRGEITDEYLRIRKMAEWNLGMWAWQKNIPKHLLPKSYDPEQDTPKACKRCKFLPAGSDKCREHPCPK